MKIQFKYFLPLGILIMLAFAVNQSTPIYFKLPDAWPEPVYDFKNNALTLSLIHI
jgi:hypothetical protein